MIRFVRCGARNCLTLRGRATPVVFSKIRIDASRAERLLSSYPDAPHHPQPEGGMKLAAGWLIDRCGLKGYRLGGAAVHDKQALVLVNADNATGEDIAALTRYVRQQVAERFAVWLDLKSGLLVPLARWMRWEQ